MKPPKNGLFVKWSRREKDLVFGHDKQKCDASLLYVMLCCAPAYSERKTSVIEELEARGFDITTLKISIKRKSNSGDDNAGD